MVKATYSYWDFEWVMGQLSPEQDFGTAMARTKKQVLEQHAQALNVSGISNS